MPLKVYNTLTRKKETFKPLRPGKVGMYVCGITAYDDCHLGHARAAVNFDVIFRYLKFLGYGVTFVRNYTDVDDKIIKKAHETGKTCREISEHYIKTYECDMETLGTLSPDIQPKATEHIPDMIATIEKLISKGRAYVVDRDVFYSVRSFPSYGQLSGKRIEDLESGARVEIDERKKDPLDFALWKSSKPGEPEWNSPWGKGRPGWHIECSAMSTKYLGDSFDIHGGGRDLIFPHHENEIAQAEGVTGRPFVHYWLHNGYLNIHAEKMSKSLGNFFTIREILKHYHPEVIRYFLLGSHYRSPLDYTDQSIQDAETALERIYEGLQRIDQFPKGEGKAQLPDLQGTFMQKFKEAMDDDFNTAKALGVIFEGVREVNRHLDRLEKKKGVLVNSDFETIDALMNTARQVLGLFAERPAAFLAKRRERKLKVTPLSSKDIEVKLEERRQARKNKDWAKSDAIRDDLASHGVKIKDNPDGSTSWTL